MRATICSQTPIEVVEGASRPQSGERFTTENDLLKSPTPCNLHPLRYPVNYIATHLVIELDVRLPIEYILYIGKDYRQ